jgi:oligosaccharide repeat unit polymerase
MFAVLDILGSAWIPAFVLLGLTSYCRIRNGTWLAPSAFLGLFWFCSLAASLLAVDHPVPWLGTWVLVSLVIATQVGCILAEEKRGKGTATVADQVQLQDWTRRRMRRACYILLGIAAVGFGYFVYASLDLLGSEFTITSLIQMAAKWAALRYSETFTDPWPLRLAATWVYPAALAGGILFSLSRRRLDRLMGLASLMPGFLFALVSAARTPFLVGLVCWLGGYWSGRVAIEEAAPALLRARTLGFFAAGAAGLLFLFLGVDALRGARDASGPGELFLEFNSGHVRNYMFGPPAAFVDWFDHSGEVSLSWGGLTFAGVYDVLHIRSKEFGFYGDYAQTVGLEGTNVFTMFRGLIQDFSLLGAVLICGLSGFFSTRAYCKRSLKPATLLSLAGFYAVVLFSPLICLFSFNGPIFAWGVAWLALRGKPPVSKECL